MYWFGLNFASIFFCIVMNINKGAMICLISILLLFSLTGFSMGEENCPEIIRRLEWGGRYGDQVEYLTLPVNLVIVHHTVSQPGNDFYSCSRLLRNIQYFHMNSLQFHDIGYNFIICGDGRIYEGVGWHKVGAHTKGFNTKSISIAFMGDYSEKRPNTSAINAAKDLLKCGVNLGELDPRYKLIGARQVSNTESPGLELFREIQKWPNFAPVP